MNLLEREDTKEQLCDRRIGEILISEGLIDEFQLQEACRIQSEIRVYKPIGQILVAMKAVSQRELNLILDRFQKRARLGDILSRAGTITEGDLEVALDHQRRTGLRLGESLVQLNLIPEEVMKDALCMQLGVPFIHLDDTTIDRSLSGLIDRGYAETHLIVPVSKVGDTVILAMDDPTDTDLVKEVQTATGFLINVVTSKRAAILNALSRLYEGPV